MEGRYLSKLTARICSLEEKLLGLRLSRRVLLDLLASREAEKQNQMTGLERENRRLRRENANYAKTLLERNGQIVVLQDALEEGAGKKKITFEC